MHSNWVSCINRFNIWLFSGILNYLGIPPFQYFDPHYKPLIQRIQSIKEPNLFQCILMTGCSYVWGMSVSRNVKGTSFGWPTGIRGTFSTTTSQRTSSTSFPYWWLDPFIHGMALDVDRSKFQPIIEIGLRSLQLDPSSTHLQKRNPGRTMDILKLKDFFIILQNCWANHFQYLDLI